MSNLTQNTESLENILATVNDLPDAGSGGASAGTCTVTIISNGVGATFFNTVYHMDSEGGNSNSFYTKNSNAVLAALKGSYIICDNATGVISATCTGGTVVKINQNIDVICFIPLDAPDTATITLSNT